MFIILLTQILLFIFIVTTFKCKNNIWYVLISIGTMLPIFGLISNLTVIIIWYCEAFDSYRNIKIKNNKLNKWLYADYFDHETF